MPQETFREQYQRNLRVVYKAAGLDESQLPESFGGSPPAGSRTARAQDLTGGDTPDVIEYRRRLRLGQSGALTLPEGPLPEPAPTEADTVTRFRTELSPEDEAVFQKQYADIAHRLHLNPNPDDPRHKYDYRGAFRAGRLEPNEENHFPSEFKDPDHPRRFINGVDTIHPERAVPQPNALDAQAVLGAPQQPGVDVPLLPLDNSIPRIGPFQLSGAAAAPLDRLTIGGPEFALAQPTELARKMEFARQRQEARRAYESAPPPITRESAAEAKRLREAGQLPDFERQRLQSAAVQQQQYDPRGAPPGGIPPATEPFERAMSRIIDPVAKMVFQDPIELARSAAESFGVKREDQPEFLKTLTASVSDVVRPPTGVKEAQAAGRSDILGTVFSFLAPSPSRVLAGTGGRLGSNAAGKIADALNRRLARVGLNKVGKSIAGGSENALRDLRRAVLVGGRSRIQGVGQFLGGVSGFSAIDASIKGLREGLDKGAEDFVLAGVRLPIDVAGGVVSSMATFAKDQADGKPTTPEQVIQFYNQLKPVAGLMMVEAIGRSAGPRAEARARAQTEARIGKMIEKHLGSDFANVLYGTSKPGEREIAGPKGALRAPTEELTAEQVQALRQPVPGAEVAPEFAGREQRLTQRLLRSLDLEGAQARRSQAIVDQRKRLRQERRQRKIDLEHDFPKAEAERNAQEASEARSLRETAANRAEAEAELFKVDPVGAAKLRIKHLKELGFSPDSEQMIAARLLLRHHQKKVGGRVRVEPPKPVVSRKEAPSAEQKQETSEVHVNVQQRKGPQGGEGQVSPEEGGTGVPRGGQGEEPTAKESVEVLRARREGVAKALETMRALKNEAGAKAFEDQLKEIDTEVGRIEAEKAAPPLPPPTQKPKPKAEPPPPVPPPEPKGEPPIVTPPTTEPKKPEPKADNFVPRYGRSGVGPATFHREEGGSGLVRMAQQDVAEPLMAAARHARDLFGEVAKSTSSVGTIRARLDEIEQAVQSKGFELPAERLSSIELARSLNEKQPTRTELQEVARQLQGAVLDGDVPRVQHLSKIIRDHITQFDIEHGGHGFFATRHQKLPEKLPEGAPEGARGRLETETKTETKTEPPKRSGETADDILMALREVEAREEAEQAKKPKTKAGRRRKGAAGFPDQGGEPVKPPARTRGELLRALGNKAVSDTNRGTVSDANAELVGVLYRSFLEKQISKEQFEQTLDQLVGAGVIRVERGPENGPTQGETKTRGSNRTRTGTRRTGNGGARGSTGPPPKKGTTGAKPQEKTFRNIIVSRPDITTEINTSGLDPILKKNLRRHQRQGVAKTIRAFEGRGDPNNERAFLIMDGPGVGKTRQALAVAHQYLNPKGGRPAKTVLLVAPNSVLGKPFEGRRPEVRGEYADAAQVFGLTVSPYNGGPLTKGVINATTFERFEKAIGHVGQDTVLIIDEAQALKNVTTNRSVAGMRLVRDAWAVLFTTATPGDKPAHLAYLRRIGILEGKDEVAALEDLGLVPVEIPMSDGSFVTKWDVSPQIGTMRVIMNIDALFDRMVERGNAIKRHVSLKDYEIHLHEVKLPRSAHDQSELISSELGKSGRSPLMLAHILMSQRRQLEPYKVDAAMDLVRSELAEGRRVVIFVQRVRRSDVYRNLRDRFGDISGREYITGSEGTAKLLKQALLAEGIEDITEMHGAASESGAEAMQRFNKGDARVMIATIESGGVGVNLGDTTGDAPRTMIVLTPPLDSALLLQTLARIHRLNTQSNARAHMIFSDLPVDTWNQELIFLKMSLLEAVIKGESGAILGRLSGGSPQTEPLEKGEGPVAAPAGREEPILPLDKGLEDRPDDTRVTLDDIAGVMVGAVDPAKEIPEEEIRRLMLKHIEGKGDTKQISRRSFRQAMEKLFNTPIRVGRLKMLRRFALGVYMPFSKNIRLRNAEDVVYIAHELGHAIEDRYLMPDPAGVRMRSPNALRKLGAPAKAIEEAIAMGKALYGSKVPVWGYASEGIAEYMRWRAFTDRAPEIAPTLHAWMQKILKEKAPDLLKKIEILEEAGHRWIEQGAEKRFSSQIVFPQDRRPLRTRERARRAQELLFDPMLVFREVDKAYEALAKESGKGADPIPRKSAYETARLFQKTGPGVVRSWVMTHVTDITGQREVRSPGMLDIVQPVVARYGKRGMRLLENFTLAMHAKDVMTARRVDPFKPPTKPKQTGFEDIDVDFMLKLGRQFPEIVKAQQELVKWGRAALEYAVDARLVSPELRNELAKKYPNYVPLYRDFDQFEFPLMTKARQWDASLKSGITSVGNVVKRLTGSKRLIKSPIQNLINHAQLIVSASHRMMILRALVDRADRRGMGGWITEVEKPIKPTKFALSEIMGRLTDLGIEVPEAAKLIAPMIQLTVWRPEFRADAKMNIIPFRSANGKVRHFEVNPRAMHALQGVDAWSAPFIFAPFTVSTRVQRAGATLLNIPFGWVRNILRDTLLTPFTSRHGTVIGRPLSSFVGIGREAMSKLTRQTGDEYATIFQALGLEIGVTPAGGDLGHFRNTYKELDARSKMFGSARYYSVRPLDALVQINSIPERGNRLSEFKLALDYARKKWPNDPLSQSIYAGNAGKQVSVDFTNYGRYAEITSTFIPFVGAHMSALNTIKETLARQPARVTAAATATMGATFLIWLHNKDEEWYRELEPWQRAIAWHARVGNDPDGAPRVLRILRPHEWGYLFGGVFEGALNEWYNSMDGATRRQFNQLVLQAIPIQVQSDGELSGGAIVANVSLLSGLVQIAANEKFFTGVPIIPRGEEGLRPELQFGRYTSETAKAIGRLFKISPRKIQFIADSYTSGMSTSVLDMAERAAGAGRFKDKALSKRLLGGGKASEFPLVGTAFNRITGVDRNASEAFYNEMDRVAMEVNSERKLGPGEHELTEKEWKQHVSALRILRQAEKILRAMREAAEDQTDPARAFQINRARTRVFRAALEQSNAQLPKKARKAG